MRSPARFSATRNEIRGRSARRGEHNREVLAEVLGYDDEKIRELEELQILSAASPDER